jgi:hypothetical protein
MSDSSSEPSPRMLHLNGQAADRQVSIGGGEAPTPPIGLP